MDRTKIAFTALLPALLFLVCGQGLSAQCVGCSSEIFGDNDLTFHAGKDCSPDAVSSQTFIARRVSSRLAKSGHPHTFFVNPICRSSFLEGTSTRVSAPREDGIPLATHWQFALRMALDPRAPSSVS